MKKMILLCAGLFAGNLMAANNLPTAAELAAAELASAPAEAAYPLTINGEKFLKTGNAASLLAGEEVLDESGFKSLRASGELVVRLGSASADALAAAHGVTVVNTYDNFAVVKAAAGADLLALSAAIAADSGVEGVSVHLIDLTNGVQ